MYSDRGAQQTHGREPSIEQLARNALVELWHWQKKEHGDSASTETFFPVDAELYVREVLGWTVEGVSSIAVGGACRPDVHGRCNHLEQKIYIKTDGVTDGRRRFTVAHEIAHALLHPGDTPHDRRWQHRSSHTGSTTVRPKAEVDADVFAAEMLMPRRAIREEFKKRFAVEHLQARSTALHELLRLGPFDRPSLKAVAERLAIYRTEQGAKSLTEYFGVSKEAMANRLSELKLVIY